MSTERLVDACVSLDADVLCLQEVDRGQARSGMVDQTAAIAAAWARWRGASCPPWWGSRARSGARPPTTTCVRRARPATAWPSCPGCRCGPGTWSAWPRPSCARRCTCPAAASSCSTTSPGSAWRPRWSCPAGSGPVLVASTHLSFVPGWNLTQLRRLTRALAAGRRPADGRCVLLGDLNVPNLFVRPAGAGWQLAGEGGHDFPAPKPVDADRPRPRPGSAAPGGRTAQAHLLPLSDHRALTVDLAG